MLILAGIAAAGSFTHIRDTARQHGQGGWMAWAVAVCIDLTCVMAARERHRDKRTDRATGRLTWPTLVLAGGVVLSLAANLAQADPSIWGWLTAATPAGAFLVAVSMLERRAAGGRAGAARDASVPAVPPSFGNADAEPSPTLPVRDVPRPEAASVNHDEDERQTAPIAAPAHRSPVPAKPAPAAPLVAFARRVADEHRTRHGQPITADALRARLGVSDQLARDLLGHLATA
ncbi:DUF2637 domain-containing protein [Actinomadura rupiterrae]|uniref:DUF2637 domain-containing protein n=1 Tax=Actinomadura rupiterrae TaxID=559627 RepID=UPI0027E29D0D|nr:DUF2637 domain-containing protein [Actinomadura rupiterrae]MCP2340401.1 hypothetical protein [Actinomadura rupiterrae]